MPIYEYVCSNCQFKFELLRPLSQASEDVPCPRCQQSAKRVLSVFVGRSANASGSLAAIGGDHCGGCDATDCGTCSM